MKIDVYSFSWNESLILPYFLRHYEPIAQNIVLYDNGSTDGTIELLKNQPKVRIVEWEVKEDSAFRTSNRIRNNMWKDSIGKADWVIVCDTDEFLYHPNLVGFLEKQGDCTLVRSVAYQMIADTFPTTTGQIYDEVRFGVRLKKYDKTLIFNPNKIQEINFGMGSHNLKPQGEIKFSEQRLPLLHFKYLGIDYLLKRYAQLRSGVRSRDNYGWGIQWKRADEVTRNVFEQLRSQRIDVMETIKGINNDQCFNVCL